MSYPAPLAHRQQRSRKKGSRTPEGIVYVGRPTLWGNPFRADRFGHMRSVRLYRRWLEGTLGERALRRLGFGDHEIASLHRKRQRLLDRIPLITGRPLQCWCPLTAACHADVLLAIANGNIDEVQS